MESGALVFAELLLVLGAVLGWGIWELYALRRSRNRDEAVRGPAADERGEDG